MKRSIVVKNTKEAYILLQGIQYGNRFFTTYENDGYDHRRGLKGKVRYLVLGYAGSVEEAQNKLYGKTEDQITNLEVIKLLDRYDIKRGIRVLNTLI